MEEIPRIPAETKQRILTGLIGQYNEMLQITMELRQSAKNNGLTWYDDATDSLIRGLGKVISAIRVHLAEIDKELGRWQMFTFRVVADGEIRIYAATADRKAVKIPIQQKDKGNPDCIEEDKDDQDQNPRT